MYTISPRTPIVMITITTGIHLDTGTPPFSFSVCLPAVVVDEADVPFNNIVPVEGMSVERLQIFYQERLLLYHNFYSIYIM